MVPILGPDGEAIAEPPAFDIGTLLAARPKRRIRVAGVEGWWRIQSRHHDSALLLPPTGGGDLEQYYLAAYARDWLNADAVRRNTALRRGRPKRKR